MRTPNIAAVAGLAVLLSAALVPPPQDAQAASTSIFTEGFATGLDGWTRVTANGGSAYVTSGAGYGTPTGLRLAATSARGSVGYVQKTLLAPYPALTIAVTERVRKEGPRGQSIPLLRVFTASGTRILSVERRNGAVGMLFVSYGGAVHETSMRLGLTAWGRIAVRASINGPSGIVVVTVNGRTAFSSSSANLGTVPAGRVQLGNERSGQAYSLDADQVTITTPLYASAEAPPPAAPMPAPTLGATPKPTPTPSPTPTPKPTPTPAPAPTPKPKPTPTPAPTPAQAGSQKVVQFSPSGTQAQFLALMNNITIDVIEMRAGTYSGWHLRIGIDRSARPLVIRPAPGAAVIWDDTGGSSEDALFYLGWAGFTSWVSFDAAGTGGSFTIQNYALGQRGLVSTSWVDHVTFNGFRTRGITGLAGGQLSWTVYLSSDGVHSGSNIVVNDWDVGPSANRDVGGLQTYHDPNSHGITALRWRIDGASSAIALWGTATGIDVEGWTITNCTYAVSSDGVAAGILRNNASTSSTYAPIIKGSLVDGGGNSWH